MSSKAKTSWGKNSGASISPQPELYTFSSGIKFVDFSFVNKARERKDFQGNKNDLGFKITESKL